MGNAAGSLEMSPGRDVKRPLSTYGQKQPPAPKLPLPPEEELEERFNIVLNSMNLPPDKVKLLCQYDNEKKWELVCDQERFQVKNPPSAYIQKLKSVLEQGGGRKFKRRVQESTQVLRELEISLRTNHIGWAEEFLNEENKGLDTLVDYLSFAQRAVTKALRYSRLLSQKNHLHLCIMCLRAIMNYQLGFNQVMDHPSCVNEITLSLNNKSARTKALVLELLAAVCLVQGGHKMITAAFNNFKEVCGEKDRFEKLMEYFTNEDNNIDFMLNTRLQQCESEAVEKTSELEKQLTQSRKEVELLKDSVKETQAQLAQLQQKEKERETQIEKEQERERERQRSAKALTELEKMVQVLVDRGLIRMERSESGSLDLHIIPAADTTGVKGKKPIKTKYRMPLLNWQALMEEQVAGTVFTELDDESVLGELNMDVFEELFKTKAQSAPVNVGTLKVKVAHKTSSKITLLEPNRAKNLAITLRKGGMSTAQICTAIQTYNLDLLKSDFLELLERFIPSDYELRLIENYEREGRALLELSEEDRFMVAFSKIQHLPQRISTLTFMGNFSESIQLLRPQLNAIIAGSMSIKSSSKLKKILEIILAFGNYMNSEKRGSAYGFRLQSLDLLAEQENEQRKKKISETDFGTDLPTSDPPMSTAMPSMPRVPQVDLIAELKRRQMKPLVREGKDGAIEDIITDLRNQPYIRADGARRSAKWKPAQQLPVSSDISL
ncbi:hypothetical protein cypCar_00036912 [Cyprinus carpio]|nr:hypothetical protein cypCar_00036912 [Cyprinus carpio]